MKLEKKEKANQNDNTMEIQVEVERGVFETRTMPKSYGNYLMLSDVSDEILKAGVGGRIPYIVYIYLLKCRNRTTNQCFPSLENISKNIYANIKSVKLALEYLVQKGFIVINSGYKGICNNYYFPKEWFYSYFEDDIKQKMATRRKHVVKEKRGTKQEKELKELKEKVAELENENAKLKNNVLQKEEKTKCKHDDEEDEW